MHLPCTDYIFTANGNMACPLHVPGTGGGGTGFPAFSTKYWRSSLDAERIVRVAFVPSSESTVATPSLAYWQMYALRTPSVMLADVMCGVRLEKTTMEPARAGTQIEFSVARPFTVHPLWWS